MADFSHALVERHRALSRNESSTTVSSLTAAADILNQYTNLNKSLAQKPVIGANNPSQINFENSDNIQIVHNYYYSQSSSEGTY